MISRMASAIGGVAVAASVAVAADLPIKRVTIFSSGVAYYQRAGEIDGSATVELPFQTGQINDILKSMVLQDLGGGTIRPVIYAPKDPIQKALRSFGVDLTGEPTLVDLLSQLRGVPVEVQIYGRDEPEIGRILAVATRRKHVGDQVIEEHVVQFVNDDGVSSIALPEVAAIRITDEKLHEDLRLALEVLAGAHDADRRPVVLEFAGQGRRRVLVSYILEAPIWKTSYRLLVDEADEAFLQGWATVDNTTDQDWENVQLTLVAGRPISFVQDLYTPLYVPRPEVEPELYTSLTPQQYGGAIEEETERGALQDKAMELPGRRGRRGASSAGEAFRRFGGGGGGGLAAAEPSLGAAIDLAGAGVASIAEPEEAGELFAYPINTPVTLPRQKSAMLPIVNQAIKAEPYSIYNPKVHGRHPLNGLRLTNTTGLHLMQGPVTVFDNDTYAGDARMPDVTPGEKRLISYAIDLKREVELITKSDPEQLVTVRIVKGTLVTTRKYEQSNLYNIKNKDDRSRSVLVEQPFRADWELVQPKRPFARTPEVYRFRVEAVPNETTTLEVRQQRVADVSFALSSAGLDTIEFYVRSRKVSDQIRDALGRVVEMRMELDRIRDRRETLETKVDELTRDQSRIRENLKAVTGASDLRDRYLRKLNDQEDELEQLRAEIDRLRQEESNARQALESYLADLTIE